MCTLHKTVHRLSCYMNIPTYSKFLYKLSGKRLSGNVIVRETSCRGNNRRVESGHADDWETSFRETSCRGNVRYPI